MQACGMLNHTRKTCAFKNHELANRTTHEWDYSLRGKLWATHHKPCLTIGYALPGHQPIQHSDGHHPKPNPYAKSYSQTNSSNRKYRQNNNNNNDNSTRNNSNFNNANRDNSSGYNNIRDTNNRDRSADRSVDRSVNNDNNRSSTHFDNVNKKPRSKSDTDFSAICSAVTKPVLTEYLNDTVWLSKQMTPSTRQNRPTLCKTMETGATAKTAPTPGINCQALLDTGSKAGDFINNDLLIRLNGRNHTYITNKPLKVCTGLDNYCLQSTDVID
jgi:hypothetical protein